METLSALLAICAGNSPVTGEFPAQKPVTQSFDAFFDLRLNKRLSKQSWGWWFETLSCSSLWRHCNGKGNQDCTWSDGLLHCPCMPKSPGHNEWSNEYIINSVYTRLHTRGAFVWIYAQHVNLRAVRKSRTPPTWYSVWFYWITWPSLCDLASFSPRREMVIVIWVGPHITDY